MNSAPFVRGEVVYLRSGGAGLTVTGMFNDETVQLVISTRYDGIQHLALHVDQVTHERPETTS